MRTRHKRKVYKKTLSKKYGGKKSSKKWTTAIDAAQKTLIKTGDIEAAKKTLRKQALTNARKLFGSVTSSL